MTQYPSEIKMVGVREKACGIGEHAHKAAEQAQIRQGVHLPDHAVFLVQKPPAGAVLQLPEDAAT